MTTEFSNMNVIGDTIKSSFRAMCQRHMVIDVNNL